MLKRFIPTALVLLLLFSGCTRIVEVPVFVKAECPTLIVANKVPQVTLALGSEGGIKGADLDALINTAKRLRRIEAFYAKQIDNYNKAYTAH